MKPGFLLSFCTVVHGEEHVAFRIFFVWRDFLFFEIYFESRSISLCLSTTCFESATRVLKQTQIIYRTKLRANSNNKEKN